MTMPSDPTPEEVELGWQAAHPEGEIIHVDLDTSSGDISVDENPYGDSDDE